MTLRHIDLLCICSNAWRTDYLRFATDVTILEGEAVAFISTDSSILLIAQNKREALRIAKDYPHITVNHPSSYHSFLQDFLYKNKSKSVAGAPLSAMPFAILNSNWSEPIEETLSWLDLLILRKSDLEANAVEAAANIADEGYAAFALAAKIGSKEYELTAYTESWLRKKSCPENFMILGSGGVEVRGMHPPGERVLQNGDLVTTELTPCVNGYYAQICRTLVLGKPSSIQLSCYEIFHEALIAGIDAVKPGATHGEVAKAQNDIFRKNNLEKYIGPEYTRVRGHGVGLFVDGVHVLENINLVLEPNMTLIVHPNTYHPQVGYIVLGDTVRVTETGCKVLIKTPRNLLVVD
jgi:Xaa-Pro aminopeptidase